VKVRLCFRPLPAYKFVNRPRVAYIVTVNDYLAARDAEWMGQITGSWGLRLVDPEPYG